MYERGEARMDSSQGGIEMEKRSTTNVGGNSVRLPILERGTNN